MSFGNETPSSLRKVSGHLPLVRGRALGTDTFPPLIRGGVRFYEDGGVKLK